MNDDHLALAGLVLGKAAVDAGLFLIGRADMTAEIGAVDLDLARNRHVLLFGRDRFA
jgi:hypothetical protein